MEINIENAFDIVVKLSLRPFSASISALQEKIQRLSYRLTVHILSRPLLGTLLLIMMLMITVSLLTITVIAVAAAICIIAVIIIFEGFIFGVVFLLAISSTVIAMGCLIITQGLKHCRK